MTMHDVRIPVPGRRPSSWGRKLRLGTERACARVEILFGAGHGCCRCECATSADRWQRRRAVVETGLQREPSIEGFA